MKKLILILLCTVAQAQTIKLKQEDGVLFLPVVINKVLKIDMIMDTGASECTIPPSIANTLIKTKTLTALNILKNKTYTLADGTNIECQRFLIKSLKIGNITIYNIECSVSNSENSPLLFGKNALDKLKKVTLDFKNKKLIIK